MDTYVSEACKRRDMRNIILYAFLINKCTQPSIISIKVPFVERDFKFVNNNNITFMDTFPFA